MVKVATVPRLPPWDLDHMVDGFAIHADLHRWEMNVSRTPCSGGLRSRMGSWTVRNDGVPRVPWDPPTGRLSERKPRHDKNVRT